MIDTKQIKIICNKCNNEEITKCEIILGMLDYPNECINCHSNNLFHSTIKTIKE